MYVKVIEPKIRRYIVEEVSAVAMLEDVIQILVRPIEDTNELVIESGSVEVFNSNTDKLIETYIIGE